MTTILALRSSILGAASVSNQLIDAALAELAGDPTIRITERDLAAHPVPHLDGAAANALRADDATEEVLEARVLSDRMIREVEAADILLIGAPMYNFGIASTLKSWFDYVLRAGVTFRYSAAGPEGLLKGKRAIVILSRGGHYPDGPARAMDAQEPHLRTLLNFIGISEIDFVLADKLAFGPEAREAAIARATEQLAGEFRTARLHVA